MAGNEDILIKIQADVGNFLSQLERLTNGMSGVSRSAEAVRGSLSRIEVSAAQTAAALRQVPAQFTDIVTSLAAGQNPLTVFLQQGGQLKDMFGGAGNAARALAGYVVGLVNPVTVAAAATAALTYAYYEGSQEAQNFAKALVLTGNAAGTSVNQLQNLAVTVSAATGATQGAAAAALTEIASTGKVASGSLEAVATAALAMERATGTAVSETVKQFAELGKSPVEASLKLNEQYNYLTASVYKQIKALEEQGRLTDAAALAQKTFADSLESRAETIKSNLGGLETAWKAAGNAAKWAWDKMLNIGREKSLEQQLAEAKETLRSGHWDFALTEDDIKQQIANLEKRIAGEKAVTKEKETQSDAEKAKIQWAKEENKYLTERQRIEQESARIRNEGQAAGIPEAEIKSRIAKMREQYDSGIARAVSDSQISAAKGYASRWGDYYTKELEHFRLSTADFADKMAALEIYALNAERSAVSRQSPVDASGKIAKAQRLKEIGAQLEQVEVRRQERIEDGNSKVQKQLADLEQAAGKLTDPLEVAGMEFGRRFSDAMQRAMAEGGETADRAAEIARQAWGRMVTAVDFNTAAKGFDATLSTLETRLSNLKIGQATGQVSGIEAIVGEASIRNQVSADLEDIYARLKAIGAATKDPEVAAKLADYEKKLAGVRLAAAEADNSDVWKGMQNAVNAYQRDAVNVAKTSEQAWTRAFSGMEDALVQFSQTGKLNFSSLANSIIADLVRMQIRAAMSPMTAAMGDWAKGFFGNNGNDTSAQGNALSMPVTDSNAGITTVPLQHSGGLVGSREGSGTRAVPSSLFTGAHKYHTGGLAGDEVPTILRRGEGVFTPGQMKAIGAGMSATPSITVNVIESNDKAGQVQQRSNDGKIEIEVFVAQALNKDMRNNGPISQALASTFGLSRAMR